MNPGAGGVCVLASFMMDVSVRVPRRPRPGETVVGTRADLFLGGKGFNQAIAASRAGSRTAIVGCVGRDEWGSQFLECLRSEAIDAQHVRVDAEVGTGIGVPLVEEDTGENSIVVVPRANRQVSVRDVDDAQATIAAANVLLVQFELPLDAVHAAAQQAKEAGVIVVLNPAPAVDGLDRFAGIVDVLVPNEGEAHHLAGTQPGASCEQSARLLRDRTGAAVVVTLGSVGAMVVDDQGCDILPAHPVTPVDSVAAGDVFCGVLASCLATGASLREGVAFGNAAAAVAVTRSGAEPSIPTWSEVTELTGIS